MKRESEQLRSERNQLETDVSRHASNMKELQESYNALKEENKTLLAAKNQYVEGKYLIVWNIRTKV